MPVDAKAADNDKLAKIPDSKAVPAPPSLAKMPVDAKAAKKDNTDAVKANGALDHSVEVEENTDASSQHTSHVSGT